MKRFIDKLHIILFSLIGSILVISCSDMEKDYDENLVTYPDITITDFSPQSGRPSSDVTITGTNFGEYSEAAEVTFNGVYVEKIVSYSDTEMVVKVPEDAGSGVVAVTVWTHTQEFENEFTYIQGASLSEVSAERGQAGDTVTISGENFGDDASIIEVYIGDVSTTVTSVSDTEIKFIVPDAESGTLLLNFGGQEIESVYFLIGGELITGTLIGHSGSWGNNAETEITAAVDGDITTYVDGANKTGYVGYDLGTGKAANITSVRYVPRESHPQRMVGGEIRGANDPTFFDAVTLYTITDEPSTGVYTEVSISTSENYRYIYYYSPDGYCNIAEIEFYGNYVDQEMPEGKYIFEFDDADDDTWIPQQSATYVIEDDVMKVSFASSQFEGTNKRRADMKYTNTPWIYTSDYPIVAIKFTKPETVNLRPDITGLGSGFSNNDYETDFEDNDVYYWDLSEKTSDSRAECGVFQFKIPDITSSETGYEVDWIRTFKSKTELQEFINQ